jgi:hypothetical protein
MSPSLEIPRPSTLADDLAFLRIRQMIADVLEEHLDLDAPTFVGESSRDTLIEV